jgi:hypothetical protein
MAVSFFTASARAESMRNANPFTALRNHCVIAAAIALLSACGNPPPARLTPAAQSPATQTPPPATRTAIPSATPTRAPTPSPTPRPDWRAQNQSVFGAEMTVVTQTGGLDLVAGAQLEWIRRNAIQWPEVEKNEGQYDWTALAEFESEMIAAAKNNLTLIVVVRGTPDWAQKHVGARCGIVRSEKLPAFGKFMAALAARYGKAPYKVKFWEIWNEPDVDFRLFSEADRVGAPFGCYGNIDDEFYGGAEYAELLKAAYPAIKSADPDAAVLHGGLLLDCIPSSPGNGCESRTPPSSPQPSRFLEGVLRAGGGDYFDVLSFHAYDNYRYEEGVYGLGGFDSAWNTTGPAVHSKTRFLRATLSKYGHANKPMMNTEVGLACFDPARCDSTFERTAANYMPVAFAAALAENISAQVAFSMQHEWLSTNLLNKDLTPRPAFKTLAVARQMMGTGTRFARYVEGKSGYRIYELLRDGRRLWVLYAIETQPQPLILDEIPVRISKADGSKLPIEKSLDVGRDTLYIEWP